jgi:hypothetical protein
MQQYRAITITDGPRKGAIALTSPGYFRHINGEEWAAAQAAGLVNTGPDDVNDREWDVVRALALGSDQ